MLLAARPLSIGPLSTGWTPFIIVSPSWAAAAALNDAGLMATYRPQSIPAQAVMNGAALSWRISASIPTQTVYRCTLHSDAFPDLTVPMESFQGYLKADGSSFLSVIVPDVLQWIDLIEPMLADAWMIVYRGERFADGSEQLERIARADYPLTLRSDRGVQNSSITLSGYHDFEVTAPKTRALSGPTYRNTDGGRRRYRCDMDTFLRPGDTADILGDQFVVSDINYLVGNGQEYMEIQEDSAA